MSKEFLITFCFDSGPFDATHPAQTIINAASKKDACMQLLDMQKIYKIECIFSVQEFKGDDSVPKEFSAYLPGCLRELVTDCH